MMATGFAETNKSGTLDRGEGSGIEQGKATRKAEPEARRALPPLDEAIANGQGAPGGACATAGPETESEIMLTLFSYPELFGVADNNPYGLKIFAFLKLCGLPFRHQHIFDASPPRADSFPISTTMARSSATATGSSRISSSETADDRRRADRAAARRRPDDPAHARRSLLGDVLFALARRRLLALVQGRNPQNPPQCERGEP